MDKAPRISASYAPAPRVFPPGTPPRLGVLMLDTRFPRPPGDVGHPASWGVPVEFLVVDGMGPLDVVRTAAGLRESGALQAFCAGARRLEQSGVAAITTSCGFLVLLQHELQQAVKVPLVTSSLLQLPALLEREGQVGVLTISAGRLGREHLEQAGVPERRLGDVLVEGIPPDSQFSRAILGNRPRMDVDQAGRDVVAAAVALRSRAPHLRTVVLECTNMPPYGDRVRDATGLRVLGLADSPVLRHHLRAARQLY